MRRQTVHYPTLSLSSLTIALQLALFALGCANGEEPPPSTSGQQPSNANVPGIAAGGATTTGGGGTAIGAGVGSTVAPTTVATVPATGGSAGLPPNPGAATGAGGTRGGLIGGSGLIGGLIGGTGLAAGTGLTGGTAGAGGSPAPAPNTPPGPDDGDPGQPIVAIPNLKCGPNPSLAGLTSTNVVIGGRKVHVAYPCNKHKGAPVTFILNLHGTMPLEELKLYQVAYFAANNYVNSHNLITVAPISAGSQWGNDDGGKDEPHLKEVIDWTYSTFKDFDPTLKMA